MRLSPLLAGAIAMVGVAALIWALAFCLAGCGSVALEAGDDGPELAARDAGAFEAAALDAGDACPPTTLFCTGQPGACPQGQAVAARSVCGAAPVPVCCPVADCELAACEPCPLCP